MISHENVRLVSSATTVQLRPHAKIPLVASHATATLAMKALALNVMTLTNATLVLPTATVVTILPQLLSFVETADDPSAPIQTEAMNASAPEVTLETAKSAKTMTNAVTVTAVILALIARIQLVPITASA